MAKGNLAKRRRGAAEKGRVMDYIQLSKIGSRLQKEIGSIYSVRQDDVWERPWV